MADNEDSSNPGITIIPPPDSSEQEVPVEYQESNWWHFPPAELNPREGVASESYRLASPFHDTTVPLTGGEALSLPAPQDDARYGSAWEIVQGSLPSPFDVEEIDDTGSIRSSFSLPLHVQTQSDGYRSYPPTQNAFPVEYLPIVDPSSPTNQGPVTPYYTPPDYFLPLSPLSPDSPLTSSPSPSPSFPSTLHTTPEGGLNRVFTGQSYADYDLYKATGQERGRPLHCERPSAPPSSMSSPYEQQPLHLSPSLQDSRSFGYRLDVPSPRSALWETNPFSLTRRHSAGPDRRPSRPTPSHSANNSYDSIDANVGGVIPALNLLNIGHGHDPPSPNGSIALPPSPSSGRGPGQVASEAIIAACKGRRKRKAKFKCDICPQTFTAKHNLINHQKAHKGIRDQVCPLCRNAFTASGTLTRHTKTCRGKSMKRFG